MTALTPLAVAAGTVRRQGRETRQAPGGALLEGVVKHPLIHAMDGVAEFERCKRLNSGGKEHRDV